MKDLVKACLERKYWRKKHKPSIKRDILETVGYLEEKVSLRSYKYSSLTEDDLVGLIISCGHELYPVCDERDFIELSDMLINDYLYQEVSINDFEKWTEEALSRYFSVLFFDTPLIEKAWVLLDDPFGKDAIVQHVDKSVSFLYWRGSD